MKGRVFWPIAMLSGLGACAVGPDYREPRPILPDRWQAARPPEAGLKPVAAATLTAWWKTFGDPQLDRLIEQARQGNLDLGIAFTRIEQARAERLANRAALFPQVGAAGVASRFDNLIPGQSMAGGGGLNYFLAGFDAIWEIDVFGRLRRKLEAATAQAESAAEDYRQAWVLLSAEVARAYTEYRNLQNRLRITRANLASQRRTLDLTETLFREGVGTRYDVARSRAQTEATESAVPGLEGQITAARHQLEWLIGARPGTLSVRLTEPADVPDTSARELLISPAETLRQRPDVRGAERRLAAATATQGAAFAELFPKISVAAFAGLQNSDLENLFRSSSFAWASGSAITQPIFNFGRIRAGIDLADARQREAWLSYEKAVLEALRETESAMAQFLKEEQRGQKLAASVADLRESHRLADLRYREGLSTFLEVLDAERALYQQELELAESRSRTATFLIALYKALGGAGQLEVRAVDEPLRPWG